MEETKHCKQIKTTREQRKHDTKIKLRDATVVEKILSVATVNNEDRDEYDDEDSTSDVSETNSYCRHCLRPQSELQLKYMRPRQCSKLRQQQHTKRERSKQRFSFSSYCVGSGSGSANMSAVGSQAQKTRSKKSRSKSRAKRVRNSKNPSYSSSSNNKHNNHKEQHLKLPLIRDLNVANEQAIRFRCPQVGPQVGRDRQMPPMLHFHHPQHVQKQLAAYQVQYTHVYEQHQQQQRIEGRQVLSPMQTTTLTMESELKQQQQHHYHQHLHHHHHHYHYCHQHNEHHLSNNQKSNKNQLEQLLTSAEDLTAINATTATPSDLQNCCSSIHQPNQQTTHHQSPKCSSDYKQLIKCGKTNTASCCCCCCSNTADATTIENYHHQHHHHHHNAQHQQHHNLPQLPLTHLETASTTAVASLDATTLVVTATATCTNTTHPSQNNTSLSLPLAEEHATLNLNNPTTTEENPSNLAVATTPDSPSLVKVSTWYTVAKQGVSC